MPYVDPSSTHPLTFTPSAPTAPSLVPTTGPTVTSPVREATAPPCSLGAPATAAGRDLTVDLLRAIAMVLVVVGHWLVVVPSYADGRFDGVNALATVPVMRPLTWIFQVMPLFFAVGGYAAAASWASAQLKGHGYGRWLAGRLDRLVRPFVVLVAVWVPAAMALRAIGLAPDLVATVAWLVVVPVWFLAMFAVVTAAAPAMIVAHRRWGIAVPLVLVALATAVDVVRFADPATPVAYLNFFAVFGLAQQLGVWWHDGRLTDTAGWWALGGIVALVALTSVGPYPVSQVGVPGETVANNAPPTLSLVALGIAQVGLAARFRSQLARLLERRAVAGAALVLNLRAMSVLLWHFSALALAALVLLPTGLVPSPADGTRAWWLVRAGALVVLAPVLAGLVAAVGRQERPSADRNRPVVDRPTAAATAWLLVATALFAASCSVITLRGLSIADGPAGVPLVGLGLLAAAVGARRLAATGVRATAPADDAHEATQPR